MVFKAVIALALVLGASAIRVTNPTNTTVWESKGSQIIEWTSVNTDPSSLNIQLIDPSKPNDPVSIAENVDTSSGSYTYTPSSDLAAGNQYRVNIVSSTSQAGILAQSDYFAVEQGTSSVSASSAASSATSFASSFASTATASSRTPTSSAAGTAAAASSAAGAAASASHSSGAGTIVAPTGLLALIAAAVGIFA